MEGGLYYIAQQGITLPLHSTWAVVTLVEPVIGGQKGFNLALLVSVIKTVHVLRFLFYYKKKKWRCGAVVKILYIFVPQRIPVTVSVACLSVSEDFINKKPLSKVQYLPSDITVVVL